MADYTLDWATAAVDGPNIISGLGAPITVTVGTPLPGGAGNGEFAYHAGRDALASIFPDPGNDAVVTLDFSSEVSGVTFDLLDVDVSGDNWIDTVEIFAYDINGVRLDVVFSNPSGQITTAYTATGGLDLDGETITVSIAGPVASMSIVYKDGPQPYHDGWIAIGDITFDEYIAPCFTRGTMIETNRGEVAIEDLLEGDLIRTLDNGFKPILWVGSASCAADGRMAPVLFKAGAIGNTADLLVSPAHRMIVQNWQSGLLFDESEVLVAAINLVNDSTITVQKQDRVEYFHILFDQHEIVFSNGAASESFHPGQACIGAMAQNTRREVYKLFPELETNQGSYGPPARATLTAHESALLNL